MRQHLTQGFVRDTVWLSGWVFADLLLGLAILFLATTRGTPAPTPTQTATLTPTTVPPLVLCVSADGEGLFLRSAPDLDKKIGDAWQDGSEMTVLQRLPGQRAEDDWFQVRTPSGQVGYMPAKWLSGDCGPTKTPTRTLTTTRPPATATPTPTLTRTTTPTRTLPPTIPPTAVPATPTYTPTPVVGLSTKPFTTTLRIDTDLVPAFSAVGGDRNPGIAQLREQLSACFGRAQVQAGMVLTFGANPNHATGASLAAATNSLLKSINPVMFANAVTRDFHYITGDPLENGTVLLEVYLITRSDQPTVALPACSPKPLKCEGSGNARLMVYNWKPDEELTFTFDGQLHQVQTASGENPTYLCLNTTQGQHSWRASYRDYSQQESQQFGAQTNLYFCVRDGKMTPNCLSQGGLKSGSGM